MQAPIIQNEPAAANPPLQIYNPPYLQSRALGVELRLDIAAILPSPMTA